MHNAKLMNTCGIERIDTNVRTTKEAYLITNLHAG